MANPWFRMYSEFATDPKVQMLSESNQRRYIMLLCLRCSNGDVTLQDCEVAFQLRISNEDWATSKAVLVEKNLIDSANSPVAWNKRQYASDSSAARVAKHREGKKQACNVTVTPPDTDTDTDTDTEEKKEQKHVARATRFADFWSAYPKKAGKQPAEKAWKQKRLDAMVDTIVADVRNRITADRRWVEGFIPDPVKYLREERWTDEVQRIAQKRDLPEFELRMMGAV
jgi:hypothetical protein